MGLETAAIIAAVSAAVPALFAVGKQLFPGDSGAGSVSAAGAQKMADMQKAASAYGAYRPDAADARMKAMAQQLSSFKGAENIMKSMYGGTGGGGTYTPGGGGYTPPPHVATPDGTPASGLKPGTTMTPDQYAAWKKWADEQAALKTKIITTDPGRDPYRPSGPIIAPGTGGGISPGSSGTSFTGPLPPPDQTLTPMAMMLARNRTV